MAVPGEDLRLRILAHNGGSFAISAIRVSPAGGGAVTGDTYIPELRKGTVSLNASYRLAESV